MAEMNVRLSSENAKTIESIISDSKNPQLKNGTVVNFELSKTKFRKARKEFVRAIIPAVKIIMAIMFCGSSLSALADDLTPELSREIAEFARIANQGLEIKVIKANSTATNHLDGAFLNELTNRWPRWFLWQDASGRWMSSNNIMPASFESSITKDDAGDFVANNITNINVSTYFHGTIQVGTNFYTVKDLQSIPPGNFSIWNPQETNSKSETNWLGCPFVSDGARFTPSEGFTPQFQIGLRADGVVVWRNTP